MKPQCSCVVYSGILLTWDPLGGFGGGGRGEVVGVENAQQDWGRDRERERERKKKKESMHRPCKNQRGKSSVVERLFSRRF